MTIDDQLRRDEGLRLQPYRDSVNKWTIGYGRNLSDVGISKDEAEYLLANDITEAKLKLGQTLPWTSQLDDARLGVLLNMVFNMGIAGLMSFKQTLMLIQGGNFDAAADEMLKSKWAQQVGARAHRLALQLKTGVWQ